MQQKNVFLAWFIYQCTLSDWQSVSSGGFWTSEYCGFYKKSDG